MTKDKIIKWLDRQREINKEAEESPIRRLDMRFNNEIHIKDALKMGEELGIMTIVDEYGLEEYPYIGYFFYKEMKVYSLYKEELLSN